MLRVDVTGSSVLRFDDGLPVRAASGITAFRDGWLVAQDDATHAAWWTPDSITRLRLFAPIEGHDTFSEADGTKPLKPDLEAACEVRLGGVMGALLLGSGSSPARNRAALIRPMAGEFEVATADLGVLYATIAACLGIEQALLNLEGACAVGDRLRCFNRGNLFAGLPNASVDVLLAPLLHAIVEGNTNHPIPVSDPRFYELGEVDGVGLAITDAVALPDGRIVVSAAAEDTPNAVDDGPVVAAGIAVLDEGSVAVALLDAFEGVAVKIEGLAVRATTQMRGSGSAHLIAVVDGDDPTIASLALDVVLEGL